MRENELRQSKRAEPGIFRASLLTVFVHAAFAALLFFGFNWKTEPLDNMEVEIWDDLPPPKQQSTTKELIEPEPLKPIKPTVEPKPVEPVKEPIKPPEPVKQQPVLPDVKAPAPPQKPDIAVEKEKEKEKQEQERIKAEKQEREAEEKKKRVQEALKKKKKEQELERKKKEKLKKERAAQREKARIAKQKRLEQEKLERQLAAEQVRIQNEIAQFKAKILAKIKSRIVMPPDIPGNPAVEFNVTVLPGGDILDAKLLISSGYDSFDKAVERAIFLSKPLPLPSDPALFSEFRNLNIKAHYQE